MSRYIKYNLYQEKYVFRLKLPNWYSKYISYPKSILTAFFNVSIVIIFAIYHVDYSWWIIQKKFVKGKSILHAYVFYRMKIFTMQIQEKSIITYFCSSEEDIMQSKSNGFYWFSSQQNKLHNSP